MNELRMGSTQVEFLCKMPVWVLGLAEGGRRPQGLGCACNLLHRNALPGHRPCAEGRRWGFPGLLFSIKCNSEVVPPSGL